MSAIAHADGRASDVQRLQQQRDHQQLELQLKMQQQQHRSAWPAPDSAGEFQRRMLERDQQVRQQQLLEQQSRALIAPHPVEASPRQHEPGAQEPAEQVRRLGGQSRADAQYRANGPR